MSELFFNAGSINFCITSTITPTQCSIDVPGDPTTYHSVSTEQRLKVSPAKQRLSDVSWRKKGGGVASSDAAATVAVVNSKSSWRYSDCIVMVMLTMICGGSDGRFAGRSGETEHL